jgi:hypothetical protein
MAEELGDGLTARLLGRKPGEEPDAAKLPSSALPPPPSLPTLGKPRE